MSVFASLQPGIPSRVFPCLVAPVIGAHSRLTASLYGMSSLEDGRADKTQKEPSGETRWGPMEMFQTKMHGLEERGGTSVGGGAPLSCQRGNGATGQAVNLWRVIMNGADSLAHARSCSSCTVALRTTEALWNAASLRFCWWHWSTACWSYGKIRIAAVMAQPVSAQVRGPRGLQATEPNTSIALKWVDFNSSNSSKTATIIFVLQIWLTYIKTLFFL